MTLPLSPCGRAVDMLRSCYAADMQFYFDSPATLPIVWYFVPDDRPALPFSTVFSSRIYDRGDEPQLPIGELYKPVPWRGGQAPGPVASSGNCGNADAWVKGVSINDPLPDVWPGTDVPKCCAAPPPQFFGEGGGGGIMSEPFRGEAGGGGRVVEPAIGEAAGGGVFALVEPFTREAAGGGRVVEPAIGEAAGGGIFSTFISIAGGGAGGGDFVAATAFAGAAAGGGDFTFTDTSGITSDCAPDETLESTLTATFTNMGDPYPICDAMEGIEITLTAPGIYDSNYGLYYVWSSEPFDINGTSVILNLGCYYGSFWYMTVLDAGDLTTQYQAWGGYSDPTFDPFNFTFNHVRIFLWDSGDCSLARLYVEFVGT